VIRALRRRHRILALGMLLGGLGSLALAVQSRPGRPVQTTWPIETSAGRSIAVEELGVELRLAPTSGGGYRAWVRASRALGVPDPLLYMVPAAPSDSGGLPSDAVFMGSLAGQFREPVDVAGAAGRGFLVVWSNGRRRVAAVAPFDFRTASRP